MMNTSWYIVKYLRDYGVKHVFGVIGSAMYRLFQALGELDGIDYICPLHEQAVAMGADAYSRAGDTLAVGIATCGPGTTNLLTGCAGAYTDSIPVLYLVGYPNLAGTKKDMPIRSLAYQEFDIVGMFEPVTKYVKLVQSTSKVKYELQKAIHLATTGRKGPVMLVLPENVMFADLDEDSLVGYDPAEDPVVVSHKAVDAAAQCVELLKDAKKPVLLYGGGVRSANAVEEARALAKEIGCPTALTYPMRDMLDFADKQNVGSVGIFGSRPGNFSVCAADLIIAVGTRLEGYLTGNARNFAPNAKLVVVDVDAGELSKLPHIGINAYSTYQTDAKDFICALLQQVKSNKNQILAFDAWVEKVCDWKQRYPVVLPKYYEEETTNPYVFLKKLSENSGQTDRIVVGSGMACAWVGQAFDFKLGQRWIMQYAIGAMGFGLPAAIGASFATDDRIICITGDGSLQMSIQELATVDYWKKNIKIFIVCNDVYGLIQKTQDDWNCGHHATDRENHVAIPDSGKIAQAYGIKAYHIYKNAEIDETIREMFADDEPAFCCVHIPVEKKIDLRAKGGRLDNLIPYLPEEVVEKELRV